jgi:hypothetical protein
MARTYLPTLVALVRRICIYTARYEDTIRANLAGAALVAFEALVSACSGFLAATDDH